MKTGAGRIGRLGAVLAAGASLAALAPTVGAGTTPSLRARQDALRQRDAALGRREQAAALELYALESRLGRERGLVDALDARTRAAAAARAAAARHAALVARSLATARRHLADTLRTLYLDGQPSPIAIFLGASSLDEAAAGIDGLRRAVRRNEQLLADLHATQARLAVARARLAERGRRLDALRAAARAAVASLEDATAARTREIVALRASRDLTAGEARRLVALARRARARSAAITARAAARRRAEALPASSTTVQRPTAPAPTTTARTARTQPATSAAPTAVPASDAVATTSVPSTHTLVVDAVAYHLPGHTASGLPVGMGVVAVDPTVIPLGTRLFVPGYGPAVAADVGSAVRGTIIDLWMPSRARALAWGRRTVTITVYG